MAPDTTKTAKPEEAGEQKKDAVKDLKDAKGKPLTEEEKKKLEEEEELSDEDKQLKEELEMLVERLTESDKTLYKPALETLRTLIRTSTSSMTAVPKPLKFLRPHYSGLITVHESWPAGANKNFLADILSVLSMSFAEEGKRDSLKYRLLGTRESAGLWGHEYVRHLALELIDEYGALNDAPQEGEEAYTVASDSDVVTKEALDIVPFLLKHNAEADAVDLMLEIEALEQLPPFVDKDTFSRVCLYLLSCVQYVAPPDDVACMKTAHTIYRKQAQFTQALQVSMRLQDQEMIEADFNDCPDLLLKKQLAFLLARQGISVPTEDEEVQEILNQSKLSEHFRDLARDLDVLEAKTPEDIYKSHLENVRGGLGSTQVDSAKQNLASTFVNAFVNAGFKEDKLMTPSEDGSWIYKNKEHGMMSAAASLGVILLWNVEEGLTHIDKYLYSQEDHIKAGALLAIGLVNAGVRNESDPALALLSDYVDSKTLGLRIAAIVALGIAYAGTGREDVAELLTPLVGDYKLSMEISSLACLSLGLIFVGQENGEVISAAIHTLMMDREGADLKDPYAIFMGLGVALMHMGKQSGAEATLAALEVMDNSLAKTIRVLVDTCAYAGTGNVLSIQRMLHYCNDHIDADKENDRFQAFAVIGIALIAMGEDIGTEMALRSFNHLMHYGEPVIRRAVPLALGLLCASNPVVHVLDVLSKYSHDNDHDVSINAIFAMGLVGAGTNNARLAQMLRQLAAYYHKEPNHLFVVRIAQGLVHLGKGTLTLNPFHSNRTLLSPVAVAGLLVNLVAFTDAKNLIFGKAHYLLYHLVISMYPRLLMTLDENLKPLPVTVRVGQAVDVVGQAGRPKTITGFQTHSTPVLLAYTERAELATEEYLPLASVLEGFVILKKNPDYVEDESDTPAK
ncbi:armadillo-type protein [Fimicolochytrium jonesii]|uniref:armadillo-type protein n=1 Tax=Fimicolochytrium jonesii TaxID=1396493 RepID=UPI0022FE691B|nr:armadillo-type protein [Fimicolochytrium jonesii]KAI8825259.1 armadillo-type protein [Fimicolochytrium jonesii]